MIISRIPQMYGCQSSSCRLPSRWMRTSLDWSLAAARLSASSCSASRGGAPLWATRCAFCARTAFTDVFRGTILIATLVPSGLCTPSFTLPMLPAPIVLPSM